MRVGLAYGGEYPWDVRVEKILRALQAGGHETFLLCRATPGRPDSEILDEAHVHRCALPGWLPAALAGRLALPVPGHPLWTRRLKRLVASERLGLVIARDVPLAPAVLSAARAARIPAILDMAENYPAMLRDALRYSKPGIGERLMKHPGLAGWLERRAVPLFDRVLVVVEESRDRLVEAGVRPGRIAVVSNTPDALPPPPPPTAPGPASSAGELEWIYVGGLQPGRGLDTIVRALPHVRSGHRLVVLGEGPDREALEGLARTEGVAGRVHFAGWVAPGETLRRIAGAGAGLVPHRVTPHTDTTIPNKLFDYMACSLPVLVSDARPLVRIIEEERCGRVYEGGDPLAAARAMDGLLDPAARAAMGRRGRQAVERRYNWRHDAAVLLETVAAVAASESPAPGEGVTTGKGVVS